VAPRVSLICHASTRSLRAATFGGDDPIDDVGRAKAERLAGTVRRMDRCLTSPALRARETAAALGFTATVDERLRDCDFGRWSGRKFTQVLVREPIKLAAWMSNPSSAPHGGESIEQLVERVTAWMREPGRDKVHTVAITHASVIRAAIVYAIGAQLQSFWRIDVVPLSLTDLRTNGRRWVLRSMAPMAPTEEGD
jgi:broad specificity phosphatase PhoE